MEGNRDDEEDQSNEKLDVCRLCLGFADVTVNLSQHVDKSTSLIEKIHYCTSLIVKVGDDFPQNICTHCAKNLDLIYNFKSKAIACDLELSKNIPKNTNFTYIQVSDDPLNMTFKLDLEEQDSSTHLGQSCVYNIVDGDELTIEPVKVDSNKSTITVNVDKNDDASSVSIDENVNVTTSFNNDDTLESTTNGLNEILNTCRDLKSALLTDDKKKSIEMGMKRQSEKSEKNLKKKLKTDNVDNDKPLLIVKNGKVVYICNQCSFEAESMTMLLSHRTRVHLDMGNYKCSDCPTHYKTPGLLKRHISMHHDMAHVCKYCEKRFSNKQTLDRHINSQHNITPLEFQCVKCNAYFDTMDKMEDHLVVHYTNPSSTFSCNLCDRTFTSYAAKNKHIDLEHMVEIECDICHVVLPTKEAMDKHNISVHQPKKKGNKKYACTTCGKCFSDIKDILNHREIHLSNEM